MSHFDGNDGTRYYPFGRGHVEQLMEERRDQIDSNSSFSLPIDESLCASDNGVPLLFNESEMTDKVAQPFLDLAEHVDSKIEQAVKEKSEAALRPAAFFDDARNGGAIVLRFLAGEHEGRSHLINPAALRRDSRDASIHELTGEKLLDPATISEGIKAAKDYPTRKLCCGDSVERRAR